MRRVESHFARLFPIYGLLMTMIMLVLMSLIYLISPIHLYNDLIAVHHYEKS